MTIDFERRILFGSVHLQLHAKNLVAEILLDTSYLEIHEIKANGQDPPWELLPRSEPFGSTLKIKLTRDIPHWNSVNLDVGLIPTPTNGTALQKLRD